MINRFAGVIATFCYVGYAPAPGTVASFVTLLACWFLPIGYQVLYGALLIKIFVLGLWAATLVEQEAQIKDPSFIVIDEVLGMALSVLFLPKSLLFYALAFVLFRFFDISKVFPVNVAERLPQGWGIMADDAVAGIMTFLIVIILNIVI